MIASTQRTNTEIFAFIAALVFRVLSRKVVYNQKKHSKLLKSRLLVKKIASFMGKFLNFQDTFETRKRSFISAFLICMSVPFKQNSNNRRDSAL